VVEGREEEEKEFIIQSQPAAAAQSLPLYLIKY
jgi:hypothetical protein